MPEIPDDISVAEMAAWAANQQGETMTTLDYDKLVAFDEITITYHGYGDEGHIEDIVPFPLPEGMEMSHELQQELESFAYDVLEANFGGWEINEGSDGTITIDVKARKAKIHHGWTIEEKQWEDVEL